MKVEINPEDRQETGGCQCKVALAAAQDGICQPGRDKSFFSAFEGMNFLSSGQQLLVGPTGYGECGCIQNPVHVTMGDNHTCHPLYHQVADLIEIMGAVAVCYLFFLLSTHL